MDKKIFTVNGMSCNHCKMSVEKALQGIGVNPQINLEEKTVTVEYDSKKITVEQIITEIEDQGYDVVK